MARKALHQRVARCSSQDDVLDVADRGRGVQEGRPSGRCREDNDGQVCSAWRRNEHLLFECTTASVVKLREEVGAAVEKKVSRLVKPGPARGAIMVPWRLDKADRPPYVKVVAEVEAALGTVLGAETPAEGFRKLVSRQSTGDGGQPGGCTWGGKGSASWRVRGGASTEG